MRLAIFMVGICLATEVYQMTAKAELFQDLGNTVVFLIATPNAERTNIGTGVLITEDEIPFLVTAHHVAKDLSNVSLAVIRAKDGTALKIPLSKLISSGSHQAWRYHETADLAVLRLDPDKDIFPQLINRFISSTLLRQDQSAPPRSITLTVMGFPLALGVHGKFSPISRETKAASDLLEINRADTKTPAVFFITQDPSIGGFSGGPVFDTGLPYAAGSGLTFRSAGAQVVGIVHGTLSDDTGGKLGAVTPAYLLLELIHKAKAN